MRRAPFCETVISLLVGDLFAYPSLNFGHSFCKQKDLRLTYRSLREHWRKPFPCLAGEKKRLEKASVISGYRDTADISVSSLSSRCKQLGTGGWGGGAHV